MKRARRVASRSRRARRRHPTEVRRLLLRSAATAFAEQGFHGATTKEIAERAGVAEPLLFRHFGSKAQLFLEAALEPFAEIVAEEIRVVGALSEEPWTNEEIMRDFVGRSYDVFRANRRLILSLVAAAESGDPEVARLAELPGLGDLLDRLGDVAREAAIPHDMATVDIGVSSRALPAMVLAMAVFDSWFRVKGREGKAKRDRIVEALTRLALYGTEYQAQAIRDGKSTPLRSSRRRRRAG